MELNEELGFPPVAVDAPAAVAVVVDSPAGQVVIVEPGVPGPPGAGVNLAGAVKTYADLPTLGIGQAGAAYVVQASGLLYVWDGTAWPAEDKGSPFKGDKGDTGRGVKAVTMDGDSLAFSMSDNSTEKVAVPQIKAASDSASAAAARANEAEEHRVAAQRSAEEASESAITTAGHLVETNTARDVARAKATEATQARDTAVASASTATTQAVDAIAARDRAETAASNASGDADNASTSESNAAASRDIATAKATESGVNADNAATKADAANADARRAEDAAARAENAVNTGVADASATVKGGIRLPGGEPGELGGTWDHPKVTGWDKKADLVGGKIPSSQIPSIATHERAVVNTTAERLALTTDRVQPGDVCIQIGNPGRGTYFLQAPDPSQESSWVLQVAPTDAVTSVNGYTGAFVLGKQDLELGNVDNTSDAAKPISAATQAALDTKALAARKVATGTGLTGGGDLLVDRTLGVDFGTGAGKVVQGNDTRLSDQRVPTDGSVTSAKIADGTIVNADIAADAAISVTKLGPGRMRVQSFESGTPTDVAASMIYLSQAEYDALGTKAPYTVYVVR